MEHTIKRALFGLLVVAAFGAPFNGAMADEALTVSPAAVSTVPVTRAAARTAPSAGVAGVTVSAYSNADPLRGIYQQKPVLAQCGDEPVVGPLFVPQLGSLQAQPGYNFLMDPEMVGMACRKAI